MHHDKDPSNITNRLSQAATAGVGALATALVAASIGHGSDKPKHINNPQPPNAKISYIYSPPEFSNSGMENGKLVFLQNHDGSLIEKVHEPSGKTQYFLAAHNVSHSEAKALEGHWSKLRTTLSKWEK
jgi:hypothetical protein